MFISSSLHLGLDVTIDFSNDTLISGDRTILYIKDLLAHVDLESAQNSKVPEESRYVRRNSLTI
jgi:hypothetical protein